MTRLLVSLSLFWWGFTLPVVLLALWLLPEPGARQ